MRFVRDQPLRWAAYGLGLVWAAEGIARAGLRLYGRRFIALGDFRCMLSAARALERAALKVGFGIKRRTIGRTPPKRVLPGEF
jgi:hypothetical protein